MVSRSCVPTWGVTSAIRAVCIASGSAGWCSVLLTHRGEGAAAGEVHVELVLQVDEGVVPGVGFRWCDTMTM